MNMKITNCLIWSLSVVLLVSCHRSQQPETITTIEHKTLTQSIKPLNFIGQWMGEGRRETIIRDYVRDYGFLHQEVNINLKFPEEIGYDRYQIGSVTNFIESVLLQDVPEWDIILINDEYDNIAMKMGDRDWARKYLVDFSTYPELVKNTIPEIDLEKVKAKWGGIIPGPFLEGQFWALWCNTQVTKKLGIEVKQKGMTFDDFVSYLAACYQYNQTHPDRITPFKEASDWTTAFTIAINLFISELQDTDILFSDKVSAQKLNAWYKTLRALETLSKYDIIDQNWRATPWSETRYTLLDEQCLFYSNGSWMYNIWVEKDNARVKNCVPNEYPGFKPLPIYPSGYPIMWGVLKKAPNKDEAIKFLLSMNQPQMAEMWVRNTKSPSGIKGAFSDVSFGFDQFELFSYHVQKNYGSRTYKMQENSSLIFNFEHAHEPNYFMEVLTAQMSADEAIRRIQAKFGR